MKKPNSARLFAILLIIFAFYLIIISKLFYWQVIRYSDLYAAQKLQSTESLALPAKRGNILSSDNFPLATNKSAYLVYINPRVIPDKDDYASKLATATNQDVASVAAVLAKNLFWVKVASQVDEETKNKIQNLGLAGVGFQQNALRFYPEASMAAQLIGFVGKDERGGDKGYFGIEGYYNQQLEGRAGRMYVIRDALGNPILNDVRQENKIDGRTLTLTLDRSVQFIAENKLKEGIDQYEADGGSAVVMDVETGKILAMVSFPEFDPQHYYDFDPKSFSNPNISSLYEPGSTFKPLIMAAALDKKLVTPETRCDTCGGPVSIGGYEIHTWNDKYFPNSTMTDVLTHSDNTGMVFIGRKLGLSSLIDYLNKYRIGKTSGIDLQGEVSGMLKDKPDWYPIDLATATFGQGISVTPIELLAAINSLASGGKYMRPYVVSKITTSDGKVINIDPVEKGRTVSAATSKIITWMMVNAVENGEAKWTKIAHYKIAGKTGTAQIPVAGHYDPTQTVASFVGFFPADKPKISMLVKLDRPKASIYGAETAAPIFFSIAKELINYYNIPPNY